jgi:hypothetical protein
MEAHVKEAGVAAGIRWVMVYEYTELYIPVGKKGWRELGSALEELPSQGWELFMAVPIISLTAFIPGISGSRTTAIVHYFRRQRA